jgi:hypothetical protein
VSKQGRPAHYLEERSAVVSAERVAALRERRVRLGETHLGRAAVERAPVHVDDVQQDATLGPDRGGLLEGIHAVLAVPLCCARTRWSAGW